MQTLTFVMFVFTGQGLVFMLRERGPMWRSRPSWTMILFFSSRSRDGLYFCDPRDFDAADSGSYRTLPAGGDSGLRPHTRSGKDHGLYALAG